MVFGTVDGHVAEGNVYIAAGRRLSDSLNDPQRRFLIVRDVKWITDPPLGMPENGVVFVAIHSVSWVAPLSEPERRTYDGPTKRKPGGNDAGAS